MGQLMALEKRYTSFFNEIVHYVLLPVFPDCWEPPRQMQRPRPGTVDKTAAASRAPPPLPRGRPCVLISLGQAQVNCPKIVLCLTLVQFLVLPPHPDFYSRKFSCLDENLLFP